MPSNVSVGMASSGAIGCFCLSEGVAFFWTPGAFTAAMSWAVSQVERHA